MYYNQSFDEMLEDMLLHGKLINDGGHNLFQRDPPPSFRKKRRRKYVDKEVEVDDSVFENAKQAVAPKEVKKDEIEESQHPPSEENITGIPPESVENQAVEEISIASQNPQDKPNKTHKMPLAIAYLKMPLKSVLNSSYLRGLTSFITLSKSSVVMALMGLLRSSSGRL